MELDKKFAERVEELVGQIPKGRVMTYGQLAALCGNARAARIVGGIAHFGDPNLPWQRVVNKKGGLAAGYPGGRIAHKKHLEAEDVIVSGEDGNYYVSVEELLWRPKITLEAMLKGVTPEKVKDQFSWGEDVGLERWWLL
jgi:methylated-DNA-protein-cysteine methyltransferase-like protein